MKYKKKLIRKFFFITFLIYHSIGFSQNQWLLLNSYPSYASTGDLDIDGNQITVEAIFYALPGQRFDLVSKHGYSTDANYLLRADHCEITTTSGFYFTNNVSFDLYKSYHVAFTYDGQKLRFYQNGCLKSEVNASGNMITNNYPLKIGQIADPAQLAPIEQYYGYIDEVRIWNVCRTQQQIVSNIIDLSNPTMQLGLLAYYKFENNYNNYQGNSTWDLTNNVSTLFSSVPIINIPLLTVNLGNDTSICLGDTLILNAGNLGAIYQWNTGSNNQTLNINTAGVYWVNVNNNGCLSSDTIVVSVFNSPIISLGEDTVLCQGDLIVLTPGTGFDKYVWSNGEITEFINVSLPGIYSVTVFNGQCFSSDEIFIDECGSEIWIPNVFTPNDDGLNDFFYPVCLNISKIKLLIFNRWGNQLYEGTGNSAKWDGKFNGQLCPTGVYYYLIEYESKGKIDSLKKRHGSVTLLL